MSEVDFCGEALAHWRFVEKLLDCERELMKTFYIEAMVHGFKHGKQEVGEPEIDNVDERMSDILSSIRAVVALYRDGWIDRVYSGENEEVVKLVIEKKMQSEREDGEDV